MIDCTFCCPTIPTTITANETSFRLNCSNDFSRRKSSSLPIQSIKHKDKRANIPTEELRDFVAEDEKTPKTLLYPRDPSFDPQLVWKGKDEQDLAVPVVPIYIQEQIHPQAIIEDLRAHAPIKDDRASEAVAAYQTQLFGDFNGLPEEVEDRVDFYRHEGHWSSRMILADSLLVMASLVEKEGLMGKVQCIYLDPHYGIKFGSNWVSIPAWLIYETDSPLPANC